MTTLTPASREVKKTLHKPAHSWLTRMLWQWFTALLLLLLITASLGPAHAGVAQSIEKSALKRLERTAGARVVGKTVYRKLPAHVEASFHKRLYGQRVLKQDLIAYRYHSPLNPHHDGYVFLTTDKYVSEKQLRDRLAIPIDAWPEGQHITAVATYRIPHGTLISEGSVARKHVYKGGGYQIVVENPPDAWIIRDQSFRSWRAGL